MDSQPPAANRMARVAAAVLMLGGSFWAGLRSAPLFDDGPDNSLPSRIGNNVGNVGDGGDGGDSSSLPAVTRTFAAEGVLVRKNVRQSLEALLFWYDTRPDLRANLSTPDGQPDLVGLLAYAATVDDATAVSLVPYRPGLAELRGRMGILEGGGADISSALFWLFANRRDPQIDTDGVITVLGQLWKSRPDIHEQFLVGGRLQLVPLLFWAANVPKDDPSASLLNRIQFQLEQLPAELSAARRP